MIEKIKYKNKKTIADTCKRRIEKANVNKAAAKVSRSRISLLYGTLFFFYGLSASMQNSLTGQTTDPAGHDGDHTRYANHNY